MKNLSMILMSLSLFTLACSDDRLVFPAEENTAVDKIFWLDRDSQFGTFGEPDHEHGRTRDIWVFREGVYSFERFVLERPDRPTRLHRDIKRYASFTGVFIFSNCDGGRCFLLAERDDTSWSYSLATGERSEFPKSTFQIEFATVITQGMVNRIVYNMEDLSDVRLEELRGN